MTITSDEVAMEYRVAIAPVPKLNIKSRPLADALTTTEVPLQILRLPPRFSCRRATLVPEVIDEPLRTLVPPLAKVTDPRTCAVVEKRSPTGDCAKTVSGAHSSDSKRIVREKDMTRYASVYMAFIETQELRFPIVRADFFRKSFAHRTS